MKSNYKIINIKAVLYIYGILLMLIGGFMLPGIGFSLYYGSNDIPALLVSSAITIFTGMALFIGTRKSLNRKIGKREAILIVGLSYFIVSAFGCLPYLFTGTLTNFSDAFFEAVSGFATCGSSAIKDLEIVGAGTLFWRGLTQEIGGMGIILLTIAILPYFGIGSAELFVAEVRPTKDKLHPRINEAAKRLWYIYLALTVACIFCLMIEGMSLLDACVHSFAAMSTGGFGTKNTSVAFYNSPAIEYTLIVFMILAGTNFSLHYLAYKRRFREIFTNEELQLYLGFMLLISLVMSISIVTVHSLPFEKAFRDVLFSVVSIVTSTGFVTADYTSWMDWVTLIFFMLLFTGAMAGSTSGNIKMIRHLLMVRNFIYEFKRMLHPRAVIPVRFNGEVVPEGIIYNVLAFFVMYMVVFIGGSIILAMTATEHMDLLTAMSATATCLGGIGPGIGWVGPKYNFSEISSLGKYTLSFIMVAGRLELFTVLVLFTPYFWKKM